MPPKLQNKKLRIASSLVIWELRRDCAQLLKYVPQSQLAGRDWSAAFRLVAEFRGGNKVGELYCASHVHLFKNAGAVDLDGSHADAEVLRDYLVPFSGEQEIHDGAL